jgi:hypothetical protein
VPVTVTPRPYRTACGPTARASRRLRALTAGARR